MKLWKYFVKVIIDILDTCVANQQQQLEVEGGNDSNYFLF